MYPIPMLSWIIGTERRHRRLIEALRRLAPASAADLSKEAGIGTASIYPALMAMEERGEVVSDWDRAEPDPLRPRNRLYSLA